MQTKTREGDKNPPLKVHKNTTTPHNINICHHEQPTEKLPLQKTINDLTIATFEAANKSGKTKRMVRQIVVDSSNKCDEQGAPCIGASVGV